MECYLCCVAICVTFGLLCRSFHHYFSHRNRTEKFTCLLFGIIYGTLKVPILFKALSYLGAAQREVLKASSSHAEIFSALASPIDTDHLARPFFLVRMSKKKCSLGNETMLSQPQIPYKKKVKEAFIDYVLRSFGEILIYPTFICISTDLSMRKHRSSITDFLHYIFYSFCTALSWMLYVYVKFYMIWLLIRIVRVSFTKYDELREKELECTRFFTPVYLTIPFAILLTIVHWYDWYDWNNWSTNIR